MKRASILLIALVLGIAGCGSGPTAASKIQAKPDGYPLDICVVTGQKLGSMGDPYIIKYQGKTVKFCCSSCIKDFNKDSAKYMSMIDDAEKNKSASTN